MSLIYDIGLDTSNLERDVRKANQLFKNIGDQAEMQSNRADIGFRNAFAFAGGTAAATAFVKQLVSVRGEFQQLEIAFTTMLKSKERSDALMKDITEFAATTPFDLKQVAAGTKQLLAYGFTADSIKDNLSMLGNVASGVGSQISDVIYLYGTLKASGRVTQMDINQFAGRGIPIYEELARVLGVNVDQVRSFVSEGKVGFAEVEKAFQGMTNESGMFYNLMQEQSKSITGQISNLGDSIDMMFNEIGQQTEGFISDSISGVAFLVENYETVGKVIAGLIGTYGAYKAAVITLTAIQKAQTLIQLESASAGRALTTAQGLQAISTKALSAAQLALNKTMLANPYVLVATVVVGLAAAMWTLHDSTTATEKAQKRYNEEKQLAADLESKHKEEIDKLIETATNQALADGERVGALQALKVKYPEIFKQYDIEKLKLADILAIKKQIAEADGKVKVQSNKDKVSDIDSQIKNAQDRIASYKNSDRISQGTANAIFSLENQIAELEKLKNKYQGDVDKDNANAFLSSVTGLSNTRLEVEIKRRENLISQLTGVKKVATVQGLGTYSKDDLNAQLDSLKTERENRKKELFTGSQELAKANKELADKTKERNAILTAKLTPEDRAKQLADIDSQIEAVNKKIKLLGGKSKTDSKKADTEAKKDTQDFEAERLRQIENANKAELDLFRSKITDKKDLIDLDYELQIEAINKAENEFKEKAKKAGVANPDLSIFDKQRELAGQKRVSDKQLIDSEALESALSTYKTLLQRKEDLDKEYEKNKIILAGNPESLKALSAQYKTELESLQGDLLNDSGVGILDLYLFGDGEQFIQEKIKLAFPELKNLSQLTIEELNKVRSFVDTIGFTDEQLKSFEELGINVDELIKKLNEAKESENGFLDEAKWNSILDLANQIAGSVGQLGSSLEGFGGAIGEVGSVLSGLSSQVGNITSIFKKGATKGDIISGGISGLSDLIGMVANQIAENKKAQEEWNSKIEEGKHQMALMRIEAEGYKEANLFGVENPYSRAIAGAKQYAQSTKELYDATKALEGGQVQTGTKKVVSGKNVAAGVGSGAAVGAAVGSFIPVIGNLVGAGIGALVGGIVGLASTKTVPVFETLKKKYGEVVDSQGNLNKQVLADYSKMDDATKQLIDNWEDIKAKQEEAQALMKQNFSDLAGDLGSSLSDALVDAFKNDRLYSAIDKFDSKMNDVISGIVSQLIFNSIFGQMFTDLENKFNDSFSAGGDQSIVDELLWFNENYKKNMEAYNQAMELANSEMKNSGLTGFENVDPRTAATKGFAQASQDSISELNGRFTAVQGHTFRIAESVEMLRANSGQALKHLAGIESNTSKLDNMDATLSQVKSGIDTINLKGVKLQ